MGSIYSEKTMGGLQTFKKYLFRFAVGVLIAGIVLGAAFILAGESTVETAKTLGSCMATMFIIGIMLMVTTAEIRLIESRRAVVQVLATIGLAANLVWTVLWILVAWMPDIQTMTYCYAGYLCHYDPLVKVASIFTDLTIFGLLCGAIMNIFEGERKDILLPLKITTAVLAGYELLFGAITIMLDGNVNERLVALSGFAGVIWFFVWLVTLVISRNEKKRLEKTAAAPAPATPAAEPTKVAKTDDELRAEIEEKVRREMIEKEVRERLEKEAKAAKK